jgi:hypothetical protein
MHKFEYEVDYLDGRGVQTVESFAKVTLARKPVTLFLSIADIDESIALDGMGNSTRCAVSQACKRQKSHFPHPFVGMMDWFYKTTFIATKMKNGLPIECMKYEHRDTIARDFDTEVGIRRLRERAEAHDGKITIKLLPSRNRVGETAKGGNVPASGKRVKVSPFGGGLKKHERRHAEMVAGRALSLKAKAA